MITKHNSWIVMYNNLKTYLLTHFFT